MTSTADKAAYLYFTDDVSQDALRYNSAAAIDRMYIDLRRHRAEVAECYSQQRDYQAFAIEALIHQPRIVITSSWPPVGTWVDDDQSPRESIIAACSQRVREGHGFITRVLSAIARKAPNPGVADSAQWLYLYSDHNQETLRELGCSNILGLAAMAQEEAVGECADAAEFMWHRIIADGGAPKYAREWLSWHYNGAEFIVDTARKRLHSLNKKREPVADAARFMWVMRTRDCDCLKILSADLILARASYARDLRRKLPDAAQFLYVECGVDQMFLRGSDRAYILSLAAARRLRDKVGSLATIVFTEDGWVDKAATVSGMREKIDQLEKAIAIVEAEGVHSPL